MWTIAKEFRFEAAHRLPEHDGKCSELHGHSYRARVELEADNLIAAGPMRGMVFDFGALSLAWKEHIDAGLDHAHLNAYLANPTAELLAEFICHRLSDVLTLPPGVRIASVKVWETETSCAEYRPR